MCSGLLEGLLQLGIYGPVPLPIAKLPGFGGMNLVFLVFRGLLLGNRSTGSRRMDEMMCKQRGWRKLAILGDKM